MEVDFYVRRETYQSFREITLNKKKVIEIKLYF